MPPLKQRTVRSGQAADFFKLERRGRMDLSRDTAAEMYRKLCSARIFEERLYEMFMKGLVSGTTHLSVGQEGVAVGAVYGLDRDDIIMSNHRGHSHSIAKGADIKRMMCEILGKSAGFCKGLGGSLHIVDIESNNYGANGIVGASIPIAAGVALALKKDKTGRVILDFFGDGASNTGCFHESLNMASLWKLPIVYICENNLYGMSTSVGKTVSVPDIADRASAYGMPGVIVDGNDVFAVIEAVSDAAGRARLGEGPTLIEAKTYRWLGHSKSDKRVYRSREEEEEWMKKCPIKRFEEYMLANGFTREEIDGIHKKAMECQEEAVRFALDAPALSIEEARALLYV